VKNKSSNIRQRNRKPKKKEISAGKNRTNSVKQLYDLSYLLKSSSNNKEFLNSTIMVFITETKEDLRKMKEMLKDKNIAEIKELAHKLKTSFSFLRANKGFAFCNKLMKEKDLANFRIMIPNLTSYFDLLVVQLRKELHS
jgi:HPt (histidine-containing phosphotransfer) domain-containing protein